MSKRCPACQTDIADGKFCASCGAGLSAGGDRGRLRLSAYAAAPREHVLRPWLTTSLFPRLTRGSRPLFRAGLVLVAAAAVGFALLGWEPGVIATSVFGLPVLFAAYLHEIDFRRSMPARYLALAVVVAVGLGVVWALIAGPIVADAYFAEMGGQLGLAQLLLCGVAIPLTYGCVLVAPAAVVRALDRTGREALDGFTLGAVGAVIVNAAATATLSVPQLGAGSIGVGQPVGGLLAQALVEGVAWPLGSVAAGGVFGLALWFTPKAHDSRWYNRSVIIPAAFLGALGFAVVMGLVDVSPIPMSVYVALQVPITLGAALAVRPVIADALLHEDDAPESAGRLLCDECDSTVDEDEFCSRCGVAIRSRSRTSREARRVRTQPATDGARGTSTYRSVLGPVAAGIATAVGAVVLIAVLVKPAPVNYMCPPDCGHPPKGSPVETNPRFSADGGAFSVAYPGEGTAYEITLDPPGMNGVRAKYISGDTGVLNMFGEPAWGRTARQMVEGVLKSQFPTATIAYAIPNASVGYEPGYGVIADVYPRDTSSSFTRLRVIVMSAVRHDYALIATAAGPFHEFTPDYGTGHPSGANLEVAMDMGKYVNSFRWSGDRHRRQPVG